MQQLIADNALYLWSAYALVLGSLAGYTVWLRTRLATLASSESGSDEPDRPASKP